MYCQRKSDTAEDRAGDAAQIDELGDELAGKDRLAPLEVRDGSAMPGNLGDLLQAVEIQRRLDDLGVAGLKQDR